jgi:hypothetical protein
MMAATAAGRAAVLGGRGVRARMGRGCALVTVAVALVVVTAPPALAHGPTPDASNFASRVTGNVTMVDGKPGADAAPPPGVQWRILGADALLQVHNTGDSDVIVTGYNSEPFLRVGPEGAFENRRSPAAYLNADRYAQVEVPPDADAAAEPEWRKLSDEPRWQWHDHRIHWMAQESPPQVEESSGVTQTVLDWNVPYQVADQQLAVQGVLEWIPPGPMWPWLVGAAAAVVVPVAMLAGRGRSHAATRALIAIAVAVAVAGIVVAIGDVLATPASLGANAWAVTQTLVPAAIAVALAGSVWRHAPSDEEAGTATTLLVAAAILAISGGFVRLAELRSSQIVNALPPWSVRAVVAASMVAVVPALLLMLSRDRTASPDRTVAPDDSPRAA